jgi:hypothetical protein
MARSRLDPIPDRWCDRGSAPSPLEGAVQGEGSPAILFVAHVFQPIDDLAVELFLDGDMRHARGRRGAVPVLLARREPDHVAGMDFLDRAALPLDPAAAGRDDQGLPERMGVPRRPGPGLERDAGTGRTCRGWNQLEAIFAACLVMITCTLGAALGWLGRLRRPLRLASQTAGAIACLTASVIIIAAAYHLGVNYASDPFARRLLLSLAIFTRPGFIPNRKQIRVGFRPSEIDERRPRFGFIQPRRRVNLRR